MWRPWRGQTVPVRPVTAVPPALRILLVAALALQLGWHAVAPGPGARDATMPVPPNPAALRAAALGERVTLAAVVTLWIQAFDDRAGARMTFHDIDYRRLRDWLATILAVDPDARYPLLLAVRVYGQVANPQRQRIMLDFAHEAFVERPAARWRWLAEAAILARHRLDDMELALEYATTLARHTRSGEAPIWARDLQTLLLEDMGELEQARILLGGLIEAGEVTDPQELRFLQRRLEDLERRLEEEAGQSDE